jgi:sulfur-carrier protein
MPVKVLIPSPLRRLTDNQAEVSIEGHNVEEVMRSLERAYPAFRNRLFDDSGKLRRFIHIFVNDKDIRNAAGEQTPVESGDVLAIVPAVAGG